MHIVIIVLRLLFNERYNVAWCKLAPLLPRSYIIKSCLGNIYSPLSTICFILTLIAALSPAAKMTLFLSLYETGLASVRPKYYLVALGF